MRALQIVETAYRATLEEQDDPILWLTHSMRDAGADLCVLLTGNAVNYLVRGQDAGGLRFGQWKQTHPPALLDDVAGLIAKGVPVFVMEEDLRRRGLADDDLLDGVTLLLLEELPALFETCHRIWHW